jgi:hypothetical protein
VVVRVGLSAYLAGVPFAVVLATPPTLGAQQLLRRTPDGCEIQTAQARGGRVHP